MRFPRLKAWTREHFRRDGRAKVAFLTEDEARTAATRQHMHPYQCRFCGHWHIGGGTR